MPSPGPRTTYRYSAQFKATAVRLSQLPGVSVRDAAESLYIHPFMLSRWRKMAREGVIVTKGLEIEKDVTAEMKALCEMKRKYERLQVENDLLLSHRVHFGSKTDILAFITHHQEVCSVRTMCHLSGAEPCQSCRPFPKGWNPALDAERGSTHREREQDQTNQCECGGVPGSRRR